MLFPTFEFGVFFIVVFASSWLLRDRYEWRKLLLLAASYYFYGQWDWRFLGLIAFSSAMNYMAGRLLAAGFKDSQRYAIAVIAVVGNLAILGFFKYYGFFIDTLTDILLALGIQRDLPLLEIILPVGISFFTFQGISYVIDVYRGHMKPVRSAIDLFLFISFFPQLVAGPIVRAAHFLPQLDARPQLNRQAMTYGLLLITSGLFKKSVLAHYLANDLVDPVFLAPSAHSSLDLWMAQYAFAIQVYLDFSAYSDMAIGLAALLGFQFRKNFDRPFGATSIAQLWQRWHISLTTFLRDYLYRWLRGPRKETKWMGYRNVFITMLLAGLWHGAAWTYVIWGGLHGIALVIEREFKARFRSDRPKQSRASLWPAIVGWMITFHVFSLASIFFRAPDLGLVATYFSSMLSLQGGTALFSPFLAVVLCGCVAVQFLPGDALERVANRLKPIGGITLGILFGLAILMSEALGPAGVAPFIYYQF